MKKFEDIRALVGGERYAQALIFEAYAPQAMKNKLRHPAPKVAMSHIGYVASAGGVIDH
jgi:hypothetical protein